MSLLIRRSKMISFRLSPEEYQTLQSACLAQGVRSISDLARTAMQRVIAPTNQGDLLADEVRDLRDRVRKLSFEFNRLSRLVEARPVNGEGRESC
jgi:hypothetical protein